MHVHVAGGNSRQLERLTQRLEEFQAARVEAAGQQFDADPQASREALAQPTAVLAGAAAAPPCR